MRRALSSLVILVMACALLLTVPGDSSAQDEVEPQVLGVRVLNVAEDYFEVEWETDEPSRGGIEWGRGVDYGNTVRGGSSYETVHRLNVTGLERGTTYHFRVFAEDLSGNVGYSDDYTQSTAGDGTGGGTSIWVWATVGIIVVVVLAFLFLPRPGA